MNNKMIGRCENCDQDYCQECSENGNWMTNCGDGVPEDSVRKMAQRLSLHRRLVGSGSSGSADRTNVPLPPLRPFPQFANRLCERATCFRYSDSLPAPR